jgi:hypothetical protein
MGATPCEQAVKGGRRKTELSSEIAERWRHEGIRLMIWLQSRYKDRLVLLKQLFC